MKKLLGLATLFLLLSFTITDSRLDNTTVYLATDSTLLISGTSNINAFKCLFNTEKIAAPIPLTFTKIGNTHFFKEATLLLDNDGFNCGSRFINKDFHSLLQSKKYPSILLELKKLEPIENTRETLIALVEIQIAEHTNAYHIPVRYTKSKKLSVSGELALSLGDFKLEPPKKALGLIVVHDTIRINFDLKLNMDTVSS
ncbi:hypothetical protein HCG49_08600 [Arenibacter sp. 6A1]|uniref:hypothetical protein n=1 Tax=Arenibacter sp. 6A1 TaxID=2720391 RepID=UPI001445634D|nr:hypothetical protein [Arenibacter sp. 6A1]NKI26621.1 hypothetical protein [Arenibacter sp. 6A1]